MASKTCPFCGHTEDDGKEHRLALYIGDKRILIIPPGTTTLNDAIIIVKGTPDAYLMQETLVDGRMFSAKFVKSSDYATASNGEVRKK